eukprot:scaffold2606_cov120-Isochrysis_galbana.AAC.3
MCPGGVGWARHRCLEPPASTDSAHARGEMKGRDWEGIGKGLKRGGKRGKDRWEEREGLRVRGGWLRRKER